MEIVHKSHKLAKVVRWPINGFIAHARDIRTNLDSEHFKLDGLSSKFYLRIYPSSEWNGCLDYYLDLADIGTEKQIELNCRVWLENIDGEKYAETEAKTAKVTQNGQCAGYFQNVLTREQVLSKADFFKSDIASVCCEITYEVPSEFVEQSNPDVIFRQNLWESYANGFSDVTIKVDAQEFKVSKAVLTANSDVFKRMFLTDNCVETKTGVINIKDIKADVMEGFIQYMYIGKVDGFDAIAIDLFKAADKYNVSGLKDLCAEIIAKNLNGETFFEVLVLSYMYNSDTLKNAVGDFLMANPKDGHFANLISSGQWIDFASENKDLAIEITADILKKMNYTC